MKTFLPRTFFTTGLILLLFSNTDAQNLEWVVNIHPIGYGAITPFVCATNDSGDVYTMGEFSIKADFDPGHDTYTLVAPYYYNTFIQKLGANGQFLWAVKLGDFSTLRANHMQVDAQGNVYLAGWFQSILDFDPGPGFYTMTAQYKDGFVVKLDPAGNFLWAKQVSTGASTSDYNVDCTGLALDKDGNVYVSGIFNYTAIIDPAGSHVTLTASGPYEFEDVFVMKLAGDGNLKWVKQLGGPDRDLCSAITVDDSANVYTTGVFKDYADFDPGAGANYLSVVPVGSSNVFIHKMDSSGTYKWVKQLATSCGSYELRITTDHNRNVYTIGNFTSAMDMDPGWGVYNLIPDNGNNDFLHKLDGNGNFVWAKQFEDVITLDALTTNPQGDIYLGGTFRGIYDFDPGPGVYQLYTSYLGDADIFIEKMDQAGTFNWVGQIKGQNINWIRSICLDKSGYVYATGSDIDTVDYDPGPAVEMGIPVYADTIVNGYLVKWGQPIMGINEQVPQENLFHVFPNPTNGNFTIETKENVSGVQVQVINANGQLVQEQNFSGNKISLTVNGPSGLYFVAVNNGEQRTVMKVMKE